jgi:hypothetical protein
MFLQIMSDMSFNINHERTLDAHPGAGYAYEHNRSVSWILMCT